MDAAANPSAQPVVTTWRTLPFVERRFALRLGIALVILTGLPYLYGWLAAPAGTTYTGIHGINAGDHAVYVSYLEQVRDGRLLFQNLFTNEQPQGTTLNVFWLAAGLIARVLNLPGPLAFHVLRLALIIPFTMFLAVFVAAFLPRAIGGWSVEHLHRVALIGLAFSSGIGAFVGRAIDHVVEQRPGFAHWPMDLWVAESSTFLTLYQSPHFIASLWLLLYIVLCTLRCRELRTSRAVAAPAIGPQQQTLRVAAGWTPPPLGARDPSGSSLAALLAHVVPLRSRSLLAARLRIASMLGSHRDPSRRMSGGKGTSERAGRASGPEGVRPTSARHSTYWHSIAAGLATAVLIQFHPFYVPTIATLLATWFVVESIVGRRIRWNLLRHACIVALLATPSVAYHLTLLRTDPITAAIARQNWLPTPVWWIVLASYGFLVPLALTGLAHIVRTHRPQRSGAEDRLLVVWFIVTVALIFTPFSWQRRLIQGLHGALVLLATVSLPLIIRTIRPRLPEGRARALWSLPVATAVAIPLLGFSIVTNIARDIVLFSLHLPPLAMHYPLAGVDAMRWIHNHSAPTDAILAFGVSGNLLPMYAVRPSIVSHSVATVDFDRKLAAVVALATGQSSLEERAAFLTRERVRYMLVLDAERTYVTRDPLEIPRVRIAYRNDGATVYEVTR